MGIMWAVQNIRYSLCCMCRCQAKGLVYSRIGTTRYYCKKCLHLYEARKAEGLVDDGIGSARYYLKKRLYLHEARKALQGL